MPRLQIKENETSSTFIVNKELFKKIQLVKVFNGYKNLHQALEHILKEYEVKFITDEEVNQALINLPPKGIANENK